MTDDTNKKLLVITISLILLLILTKLIYATLVYNEDLLYIYIRITYFIIVATISYLSISGYMIKKNSREAVTHPAISECKAT